MPQALVIHDAEVDVGRELLPGDARVHRLAAEVVVPRREQLLAEVVDRGVRFGEPAAARRGDSQ